ncbi:RPM1 interacting protein 13 [Raphanus sativus]|uniref:RPM1 interacting protein 13 n=1 Tax=Raphanus sativus TaxID=3726 RepID=A0A6J0MQK5_RAPSA|nr:RPM1 interacting protein 13 [Raphanus sativus]
MNKEEETPLRGILCLKSSQDTEKIEETEDCFILDYDPLDSSDFKTKAKKEKVTPIRSILCLKNIQDMTRIEETEDCFILDFDPFDSFDFKKLSVSSDGDKDMDIIHETGQVACRDYPHPRHLCLTFPFGSTPNATHCRLCYCCVCDKPAPCAQWISSHCNASADSMMRKSPTPESLSFYYSD